MAKWMRLVPDHLKGDDFRVSNDTRGVRRTLGQC